MPFSSDDMVTSFANQHDPEDLLAELARIKARSQASIMGPKLGLDLTSPPPEPKLGLDLTSPEVADYVSKKAPPAPAVPLPAKVSDSVREYAQARPPSEDEKMFIAQLADRAAAQGRDAHNTLYAGLSGLSGGRIKAPPEPEVQASFAAQAKAAADESRKRLVEEADLKQKGLVSEGAAATNEKAVRENKRVASSEAEQDDPTSNASKAAQEDYARFTGKSAEDYAGFTAAQLAPRLATAEKFGQAKLTAEERHLDAKARADNAAANKATQEAIAKEKLDTLRNDKARLTAIGEDWTHSDKKARPTPKAYDTLVKQHEGTQNFVNSMNEAVKVLDANGGTLPAKPQARAELEQHLKSAISTLPDLTGVRRFSEGEMKLFRTIEGGDMSTAMRMLESKGGFLDAKKLFNKSIKTFSDRDEERLKSAGYERAAKPSAPAKPARVHVTGPSGESGWMDPKELPQYAGWKAD